MALALNRTGAFPTVTPELLTPELLILPLHRAEVTLTGEDVRVD